MQNKSLVFSIALGGYKDLFKKCIKTHKRYCNSCGYEYVLVDRAPRPLSSTEASWLKVALLCSSLKSDYDWVAFLDADCEVRKGTPCFSEYLDTLKENKSIFFAPGYSGRINAGVIFAKSNTKSVKFFERVIESADEEVPKEDKAPYENGHIISHGKSSPIVHTVDHHLWNNNSEISKKSYIQHYSQGELRKWFMENYAPPEFRKACKVEKKIFMLRRKAKRTIRHLVRSFSDTIKFFIFSSSISDSLDELAPYYEKRYSAFSDREMRL